MGGPSEIEEEAKIGQFGRRHDDIDQLNTKLTFVRPQHHPRYFNQLMPIPDAALLHEDVDLLIELYQRQIL